MSSDIEISGSRVNEEIVKELIEYEMKKQVRETMEDYIKNRKRKETESGEEFYSLSEGEGMSTDVGRKRTKKTRHIEEVDMTQKIKVGDKTNIKKGFLGGTKRLGVLSDTQRGDAAGHPPIRGGF